MNFKTKNKMYKKAYSFMSNKLVKKAITGTFVLTMLFLTSCDEDDSVPIEELAAEIIDCSTSVVSGETMTLEDRNNGVDYIINCVYAVNGDLIIKPGVTIQFGTDGGLNVSTTGSLQVLGQENDQIVFTGEDKTPGSWKGIFFKSNDIKNKIEYAKIEYAGGEAFNSNDDKGAVIVWSSTHLNMNNTTITNSETYGFNASYGGDELVLENNTITNCNAPMLIEGAYPTTISGGSYTGNTTDAIIVTSDQITGEHNWSKLNVPYHLPEGLQVIAGGTLTIMPGVTMKYGLDALLNINEGASGPKPSLIAVGTAAEPITFTGINEVLGAWRGIYFDTPSPLNEIGFATIEYASNLDQKGAIANWAGVVLNVHDTTFKDIQYCALLNDTNTSTVITTSNLTYVNVGGEICDW